MIIGTLKTVRWTLMTFIACSVTLLVRFSYLTGKYVGVSQVRQEAVAANAGYWDIFGDGKWHWGSR